jgi:hypothetical protein
MATDDEALLEAAPADDEPLTAEDRAAIREGLAEHAQGLVTARHHRGRARYAVRAERRLRLLDREPFERVTAAAGRLPEGDARRLVGADPPTWRLRVDDWRVLVVRPERDVILVVRITRRSTAY